MEGSSPDHTEPGPTEPGPTEQERELRALVDEYRARCLWFLREDLYPETREQALRILRYIESNADRDGFVRAARLRQWLSQRSNEMFAGS